MILLNNILSGFKKSLFLRSRWFCVLFVTGIFSTLVNAQENILPIDLEAVLELGGANNLTIKAYQLQQQLAKAEITESKSWWLPELHAGLSVHQLWGAAMNTDGVIFSDLNRQNLQAGFGANGHWKIGEGLYAVKLADIRSKAIKFQQAATRNQILLEVIEVYYGFLAAQMQIETYALLINQADTMAQQLAAQAEAGLGYQSDYLLAQSNIKHLQIEQLNAKKGIAEKTARLVGLLNLSPDTRLVSNEKSVVRLDLVATDEPLTDLAEAYAKRPEMQYMSIQKQVLETEREGLKKSMAFPEVHLGIYGSTFGDLVTPQFPTAEINAAVMWRVPLELVLSKHKGPYKKIDAKLQIQQFEFELFKNQINEELSAAKWMLEVTSEQIAIAQEGSDLARQAYQQGLQRQQLGTARPFEILQAQEMYMQAQLDYLGAVTAFNIAQYRMFVALGNVL